MTQQTPLFLNHSVRYDWARLHTFILLRWLAIGGQIITLWVADFYLNINLPLALCALAIGCAIGLNIFATLTFPTHTRLSEMGAFLNLGFDLLQLVALLYFTGGINNPFTLLILVPVTISASSLGFKTTLFLGGLSLACITFITMFYMPLTFIGGEILKHPDLFVSGSWVALCIGVVFMASYAWRISLEAFSMSQALSATQMALEREQKLAMLGGFLATAAHEFGTPLATIKLVSGELQDELKSQPALCEEARLIHEQATRLGAILKSMGKGIKGDLQMKTLPLAAVVRQASEPHKERGIQIIYLANGQATPPRRADNPDVIVCPEVIHSLRNLIQNAVDFAKSTVWIDTSWDESEVRVFIGDDGRGYPNDLLGQIGEPFLRRKRGRPVKDNREQYNGMGLGLFIAKTLLERTGATLTFQNANGAGRGAGRIDAVVPPVAAGMASGAWVQIRWDRADLVLPEHLGRE